MKKLGNESGKAWEDAQRKFSAAWSTYGDSLDANDKEARAAFERIDQAQQQTTQAAERASTKRKEAMDSETESVHKTTGAYTGLAKAREADAKMMRQKEDIAARAASMQRQFAQMAQEQARDIARSVEGLSHGSLWNDRQSQLDAISDKYDRVRKSAEEAYRAAKSRGDDAVVAQQALDAAIDQSRIHEQVAKDAAVQGFAERDTAMANWVTGAKRAMEDYRDRAKDTASQVADLFTNAATNMTDALVQFAVTGKLSFKDFADSVIRDLARIAY